MDNSDRFKLIIEGIADHIMLLDLDGTIKYINHTVPDLRKEDVIGCQVYQFVPPDFQHIAKGAFKKVIETQASHEYITKYKPSNGIAQYFEVIITPIIELGEVVSFVSRSTDITERKKIQDDNMRMLEELKVANQELTVLRDIIPICVWCKKIRDDQGFWKQVEEYFADRAEVGFSHGLCPECFKDERDKATGRH